MKTLYRRLNWSSEKELDVYILYHIPKHIAVKDAYFQNLTDGRLSANIK